jgi:hypothetical protein
MKTIFENWNNFLVEEEEGSEQLVLRLPKLRISEQWGTPGSDDRKIIEMFTSKIQGSTLSDKIASLNSFVAECDAGCAAQKDVAEILANLVFLDSLSSVIYDFNDKSGGFLFESLLAALFGGGAKQIATKGGRDQDVTDIVDDQGRNLSLKFFFSEASQYVKGSYNNLVYSIEKSGKPMIYVIAVKNRISKQDNNVLSIDFYEFSVGTEGISEPYDFDARSIGTGYGLGIRAATQKKFHLGNLNMGGSRDEMQRLAQLYTERLGSVLVEIYQQLDALSKNVNEYYLASPDAKDSALKARNNAETLKKDTEELT